MYRKLSKALNKSTDSNPHQNAFKSDDIIKQGYLRKQSAHLKAVRKRWMVLKHDCLYSYKKLKSPTETFEFVVYDSIHTLDGPLKFELISSSSPHCRTFIANSEKERNEWVEVIKEIQCNRMYNSWNYYKSLKLKSKKAKKLECKKGNITSAFMNKGYKIHNPADDPLSDESESYSAVNTSDDDIIQDIVEELAKFGYCKRDSIEAINNVPNKNDINSITEYIDNKTYDTDIYVMDDIPETSNLTNPKQWELVLNLMTSDMYAEQKLLIYLKLKIMAQCLIHTHDPKARTLSLKDAKLQETVLKLNGGLIFLYQLGFEHDVLCDDTLICDKKFNCNAVNACIEYLEDKMQFIKINMDYDRYRVGTFIIDDGSNEPASVSLEGTREEYEGNSANDDMNAGKTSGFDDDMNEYQNNPNISDNEFIIHEDENYENNPTDEMHDDTVDNEQNVLNIHNPTDDIDEIQNMSGRKQFYNFLNENNLEEHFGSFEKNGCYHIKDVEYLVNDDNKFLEKDIGIKNLFHRKKFIGECRKLKAKMHEFEENALMPPVIKKRLMNKGVVTMDILIDEIESKSELQTKLGIDNDIHCELLWNIISSQSNILHTEECNQNEEGVESSTITLKRTNHITR